MTKRIIEWNLLLIFIGILLFWIFLGVAIFDTITKSQGAFVSYGIYLLLIAIFGFMFGNMFKKGIESVLLFISIILLDLVTPPFIISADTPPSAEILNIWSSDTFVYSIWTAFGLGHWLAWAFTYLLTPAIGFFVVLYFLSGKILKNRLRIMFNGA